MGGLRMAYVLSSVSGNLISAASAGYAPTNSADVSAIASAYQVVSATATQLYAGTAYVTSVNDAPISAARAGNAANASLANSAWYDGTGRFISALPDSATVSAIASSYVESGVSSKQDTLSFAYNTADQISSINGSALGGMDEAAVSGIASAYAESAVSSKADSSALSSYVPYSSLEYNTASAISGINGSALAAGSTYSAGEGIDITDDVISVEAPVDIVAGPGIAIDNPDGNTVRVSANTDSFFKELYYNATNTNDTAGKVYALSEPITNFMYAKITVDNMEFTNAPLVYEIDVQHNTTTCQWNSPLRNGNTDNTINLPTCQLKINASGNLVLVARGLVYNTYPSPLFTNGDNRGMRVVRVVGIFRIVGGN